MFRRADPRSFPAPEWQIHRCIGGGTVDLENSGAYALEKIFDALRRRGKDGGSQTLLHTVTEQDHFVPILCALHVEHRAKRFLLNDLRVWIIATNNSRFKRCVDASTVRFFGESDNSTRGRSR